MAAGIMLLTPGAIGVWVSMTFVFSYGLLRGIIHPWAALAAGGLFIGVGIVAGGITALMKRRFWLPLSGAVCLVLVAVAGTVFLVLWMGWAEIPGHETAAAQRLLWSSPAWGICGLPSLLALVFLVKRRDEFQA